LAAGYGAVDLPDALERKNRKAAREWGWQYAFPSARLSANPEKGTIHRFHISEKTLQAAMSRAAARSGIHKRVSVHTLRHSFATHLLMQGVNIRQVQELLGHKNLQTTMVYTHVLKGLSNAPKSPLDSLYQG
jgi:site-specific recombinase XerC